MTVSQRVSAVLAVILTLVSLAFAADVYRMLGILLYKQQILAAILAIAFALVFLSIRASKSSPAESAPWYDVVLAVAGFAAAGYMAVRFPILAEQQYWMPIDGLISGSIVLLLIAEGLRRTVGWVLTIVVVSFFCLVLLGPYLPKPLEARPIEIRSLIYFLSWDLNGIYGIPMGVVSTIVVAFVFFGQILLRTGGSEFFTEISMILVGRYRGGQAKIAVTASGLFGSISGSAVSNVATTGVITIPLMRRGGYNVYQAGAIEAVASTGGQLMPPIMGAAAFLMAEFLEISYTQVVIAAVVPAILYYLALFILADLEAARMGIEPVPKSEIPNAWSVLRHGWYFPIPFAVLIYALFVLHYTPELSALVSAASMIVLSMVFGYKGQRLGPRGLLDAIRGTGHAVLDIIMIGAAAGIVIGALGVTGIGFALTLALVQLGQGNLFLLLLLAAFICILLGMGMPTAGVYILLSTLVAPSLVEVGIIPIAAHLFILYFGMMSMITPPVAIAAFAAATLTQADAMRTGLSAMRFGWLAYLIPFMFVASPTLLLRGDPVLIIVDILTAVLAIALVSMAIVGYFTRRFALLERLVLGVVGLALLVPLKVIVGGPWLTATAAVIGLLLIGRETLLRPRAGPSPLRTRT